ncbi:MAG: hypothetical protein HS101_16065 [Planctomycetia bacterium]|jgi:hypothetical protein|nr:hypothetical protein [Planctomycetia bacterium]MCC7315137.1 hypothetical protein [Planctomycetota bacterium]OQY96239.1 MAG: hypothetical protein B6D36_19645 [Planctomycetes bacterium UTPLA1]
MNRFERAIRNCVVAMLIAGLAAMIGMCLAGCTITHVHRFEFEPARPTTTQAATPFQGFVEQLSDERTEE